jgi:hypothetical protein
MKRILKLSLLLMLPAFITAQPEETQLESLQTNLENAANDTIRMDVYLNLALYYNEINRDSALFYLANGLPLAQKVKNPPSEKVALKMHPKGAKSRIQVVALPPSFPVPLGISHISLSYLHQVQQCLNNSPLTKNDYPNMASSSILENF